MRLQVSYMRYYMEVENKNEERGPKCGCHTARVGGVMSDKFFDR